MSQRFTILQGENHVLSLRYREEREISPFQADVFASVNRTDLETFELICSDIECLEPEEYLKSPVINFYMQ